MRASLIVLLTLAASCGPLKPQPEPPPVPTAEEATCITACERMSQLECELAEDTAEGTPCSDVCENTQDGPAPTRWNVECMTDAFACDACD